MEKASLVVTSGTVKHVSTGSKTDDVENVWKKRGSLVEVLTADFFFV
jgi:hypothetical protein